MYYEDDSVNNQDNGIWLGNHHGLADNINGGKEKCVKPVMNIYANFDL